MIAELRDQRDARPIVSGRIAEVEDLAAELTEAAYPVALRRKPGERWLDLQLDLWHAIQQTVRNWQTRERHNLA